MGATDRTTPVSFTALVLVFFFLSEGTDPPRALCWIHWFSLFLRFLTRTSDYPCRLNIFSLWTEFSWDHIIATNGFKEVCVSIRWEYFKHHFYWGEVEGKDLSVISIPKSRVPWKTQMINTKINYEKELIPGEDLSHMTWTQITNLMTLNFTWEKKTKRDFD